MLAPGWLGHFIFNEYYKTEEEFLFALADALREEYRAVVVAGFVLQIDDPGLPDWWDMLKPEPTVEAYRKFARLRIDAVNHALVGIPEERVRYRQLARAAYPRPAARAHHRSDPRGEGADLFLRGGQRPTRSMNGACGSRQSCRPARC